MSVKPILSVVQIKSDVHAMPYQTWLDEHTQFYLDITPVDVLQERYDNDMKHWQTLAGQYVKSGGSGYTPNRQEAQIFGWSRRAKENVDRYRKQPWRFEVIPVTIEVAS
jgi:hypothetical protein